jgi:CRP-like cAMP-binding protein
VRESGLSLTTSSAVLVSTLSELRRVQPLSLFLRDLNDHQLQQLGQSAKLESHPARANVFHIGEPAKHFHLILAGVWKLSQTAETGRIANLAFISAGEVVGVHSLGSALHWFSADVIAPSRVLIWRAAALRTLVEQTPRLAKNICEIVSRQLSEFSDRFRELMTESVEQRIARTIMRLGEKFGMRQGPKLVIETTIPLEDLAGYAGTTLFTMSRILNQWQRKGLLHRKRSSMVVHDMELLRTIADAA